MKVIYIAGPYRSTNPNGRSNAWGVQRNVMHAMALALEVWKLGHVAICPHSNSMFFQDADGCDDRVWLEGDIELLSRCDAMLLTDNWFSSAGARAEVQAAHAMNKPICDSLDGLRALFAPKETA